MSEYDPDYVPLHELRELGVFREINRRLLEPRRMKLDVYGRYDDDGHFVVNEIKGILSTGEGYIGEERSYIDLESIRDNGVIQEINRRLLHPRGLALTVQCQMDDDGNVEEVTDIIGIQDHRDDDVGMIFESPSRKKAEKFDELKEDEMREYIPEKYAPESEERSKEFDRLLKEKRLEKFGFYVQPLDFEFQDEQDVER